MGSKDRRKAGRGSPCSHHFVLCHWRLSCSLVGFTNWTTCRNGVSNRLASVSDISTPKSMIQRSSLRRTIPLPLVHGRNTLAFDLPLTLTGSFSQLLARSPGTSNGPFFWVPINETFRFSAKARAIPASLASVRSTPIVSTVEPFSLSVSFELWFVKQTSATRTAAPSMIHGSSFHASNILAAVATKRKVGRLLPPEIELVATRPARTLHAL